jgi:hypothetical protein
MMVKICANKKKANWGLACGIFLNFEKNELKNKQFNLHHPL